MNVRCLGGLYLKNNAGQIVASLQYVDDGSYPTPVLEIASTMDGVGLVVTNANASMVDDHGNVYLGQDVDYFPFA